MGFLTKKEVKIFFIFWIIFSVFAAGDRWNDNTTIDLTMAIVNEHRLEIDSYANNTRDRSYYGGHYYSDKAPGPAFMLIPLYSLYKLFFEDIPSYDSLEEDNPSWKYHLFLFLAISLISAVCGALTIILVYKISRYFTSNDLHRNLIVIVLGLCTLLPHAGRQFNSHAISAFFIFLCFYLVFKMKKEESDYAFIAGLAGGVAILSEYRAAIILSGIFILVFTLRRNLILKFTGGVLVFVSIIFLYNHAVYDSPFENAVRYYDLEGFWDGVNDKLSCLSYTIRYTSEVPTLKKLVNLVKSDFISAEYAKEHGNKLLRLLFDPFKGLFFYSPIMLLSFVGLFSMYRKYKLEALIIFFCFLIYVYHISSLKMWWMGISFGPRHLTPLIPFLMIPLLYSFKRIKLSIILFFIVLSALISLIGMQSVYLSHDTDIYEDYCKKMSSYAPLANPLFDNYFPSLINHINYQPRKLQDFLILEKLLGFRIIPFANITLLFVVLLLLWKNKF